MLCSTPTSAPPVLLAPIHVTNVGCFDRRRLHQPSAQRGRCCCCARALRILCSRVLPPPRRPWLSPRTPWSVVVCARARECACVCVCVCVCVCQCRLHPPLCSTARRPQNERRIVFAHAAFHQRLSDALDDDEQRCVQPPPACVCACAGVCACARVCMCLLESSSPFVC